MKQSLLLQSTRKCSKSGRAATQTPVPRGRMSKFDPRGSLMANDTMHWHGLLVYPLLLPNPPLSVTLCNRHVREV